jgi:phosphoglycerate kinase
MALKCINEVDVKGKRVLARFDFNVPIDKKQPGKIADASRIDLSLPTIKYLLDNGAEKITLMSHMGRPDGNSNEKYSLEPVATYLAEKLGEEVILANSCIDAGVKELLALKKTKIVLLENLRFFTQEENNDEEFAAKLSQYGDIYLNDAFGVSHRKHASVHAILKFFERRAYCGFLIQKEIESLNKIINQPAKPFVAIIGGAKVSDKIKTIEKMLTTVDHLIIGGAMAYPFLKAKGIEVGKSLCTDDDVKLAQNILRNDKNGKIKLPVDHVVATELNGVPENCDLIEKDKIGLDVGAKSIANYETILKTAKTIFWNGPLGLFENPHFAVGTMTLAKIISQTNAFSVVGGGDSVSAAQQSGFADQFSHISTGGGASLEYIEKGELPGIQALKFGVS